MQLASLLLIGFSLFTAILLITGNLLQQFETQQFSSKLAGFVLVACLAIIQWLNLQFILNSSFLIFSPLYIALLFCIAPSFYFYSRKLLTAKFDFSVWQLLHILPLSFCLFFSVKWMLPLAFLIGSGYLVWLAKAVFSLRKQRQRFKLELLALAVFFLIAISVIMIGFIWPLISNTTFITGYSILIGIAFFATTLTLLRFPSITVDIAEAAQATYTESTLKNINRNEKIAQLTQLMEQDKLYIQEDLSLAKKLLLDEPKSSVLSIGLSVGFSTQSNFYTAFRDIVGMAPGQYRKQ
ncbi:MAG: helix-turn-helix domain-containing protein [Methylococcaceae bacterium]